MGLVGQEGIKVVAAAPGVTPGIAFVAVGIIVGVVALVLVEQLHVEVPDLGLALVDAHGVIISRLARAVGGIIAADRLHGLAGDAQSLGDPQVAEADYQVRIVPVDRLYANLLRPMGMPGTGFTAVA